MNPIRRIEQIAARLPEGHRPQAVALSELVERVERQLSSPQADGTQRVDAPATRSNVEQLEHALDAAKHVEDGGAFTLIFEEAGRAQLELLQRVDDTRPLAGLPFAVKDLIAVTGHPIGAGSAVRADAPAETADADIVRKLRGLGAVPLGLTALHEFAFGVTGVNDHLGGPTNPSDPTRVPGGSSSGSAAAVATGVVPFALGTDTGGSVRIPAALCGVVGFKPSRDLYPTRGVFPLSPSLDHVGLLAADLGTVVRVHRALGFGVRHEAPLRRVGLAIGDLEAADRYVADRITQVIRSLDARGVEIVDVEWPDGEEVFAVSTAIMFSEAAAIHRHDIFDRPERYGNDVRARLIQGLAINAATYVTATRRREHVRAEADRILRRVDCVIGPTIGRVAPALEEASTPDVAAELVRNTRLGNVTGHPTVSVPLPTDGLPVGLQITSATDERVLDHARQLAASWTG